MTNWRPIVKDDRVRVVESDALGIVLDARTVNGQREYLVDEMPHPNSIITVQEPRWYQEDALELDQ